MGMRVGTVEEIAELFRVSPASVYREIQETDCVAGIPVIRVRSRISIPLAPIERLLAGEAPVQGSAA